MPPTSGTPAGLARVIDFFETLSPASIARLGAIYTDDAYFKDPFNEVRGLKHAARRWRPTPDSDEAGRDRCLAVPA